MRGVLLPWKRLPALPGSAPICPDDFSGELRAALVPDPPPRSGAIFFKIFNKLKSIFNYLKSIFKM